MTPYKNDNRSGAVTTMPDEQAKEQRRHSSDLRSGSVQDRPKKVEEDLIEAKPPLRIVVKNGRLDTVDIG